jgi:hypothetical protein
VAVGEGVNVAVGEGVNVGVLVGTGVGKIVGVGSEAMALVSLADREDTPIANSTPNNMPAASIRYHGTLLKNSRT